MSAPAISVVSEVSSHIAAIQATIASLAPTPATPAKAPTAPQDFSAALAEASRTVAGRTSYSLTPAGMGSTSDAGGASSAGAAIGASSAGGAIGASSVGAAVVANAERYLGTRYVWGGESMSGIDCSGLVQAAFRHSGIELPRTAAEQAREGVAVPSLAQAQPGDLLAFGNPAHHIAIYLGNGKLIESPEPGKHVHITDVYRTPTTIRRIIPAVAGSHSPATSAPSAMPATGSSGISAAVAAYADQFASAEAAYHIPHGLLAAVAQQESGGNARAVSPAGAQGLMQLMPSTAASMGVDAFDTAQAIPAAARILSRDLARFGNSVPLALAAYNAGAGAVASYGGIPPYSETQNYVRRITATLAAGG